MNDVLKREDGSAETLMGQIIDEFLERQEQGEQPQIEEYARRYPQLAVVLRQMLPALGLLQGPAADRLEDPPDLAADIHPEGPLGDYRLVREIGRGGMGVVYEAVQISLGRRVALKILPFAAALDAKQLQRFKNEAHAAAQLHHQNIVPVYGVGYERGVHYYAMQLIDGYTLAAVIADLRRLAHGTQEESESPSEPLAGDLLSGKWLAEAAGGEQQPTGPYPPLEGGEWSAERRAPGALPASGSNPRISNGHKPVDHAASDTVRPVEAALSTENSTKNPAFFRSATQLGIQAARALEHSHNLGVVHRDIKPTNLLVDGRGNLWITDFGLAHVHNDSKLTLTGDILGTLRYMSPEQALAQRVDVDQRTDLYSLGATLYELLTLEPAFTGSDRRELLRQIAFEEPRRPRQLNKSIPLELETIVLKALEKNPAERYATAKEMADDLERFLKDEPIRAKRPSLVLRMRKWSRRHRSVVASALIATVAVVAVAIGALLISLSNISAALTEKSTALNEKSAALEREKETRYLQGIALAGRELAAGNVGRAEELLDDCPEHLRAWEWRFLKRQRYHANPSPLKYDASVFCLAFSPDSRQIALGCIDGRFEIRDACTLELKHALDQTAVLGRGAVVRCMAYSRDSRCLAVSRQDGIVRLWDAAGGKMLHTLEAHKGAAWAHKGAAWQVRFSPDCRTLASAGADRKVRLWDVTSGKLLQTFADHPAAVRGVAFRPDGRSVVAACDDGTVKVWDRDTEQVTFSFRNELVPYSYSTWFSPDARRLAWSCLDGTIKIWDTTTGRVEIDQPTNMHQCRAIAFHPDGKRIALAGFDGTLRLLDASSGREMLTMFAHPSLIADAVFSPDGNKLASASYDHTVRIWDATPIAGDYDPPHCVTLRGHKQLVSGVGFSADGRWLASSSWDGTVKLWETRGTDLPSRGQGARGRGQKSEVGGSDPSPLTPDPLTLRYTLRGHGANVVGVAFSSDNRTLASAGWDKTIKLWDLQAPVGDSLTEMRTILSSRRIAGLAFSPDRRLLAVGQDNGIAVYDPSTGDPVGPFRGAPAPVPAVAFSPDSRLLVSAGATDPAIKIWDLAAQTPPVVIRHNSNPNASVAISPDGRLIASPAREQAAGEPAVKIWDAKTHKPFRTLKGHARYVWQVAFSPDSRYLASGSWDSTVKVWDLKAPESSEPVTLRGHAGFIYALAFGPDGRCLASGSGYAGHGEVKVWDAALWQNKARP